ncbi:MAG: cytochrome c biogenesis protein CcmE [Pelagibacterium sp. SCN 64-44]|nr:MAG: cytochrome c biogenesis protein CcmE [Pelagibacterium sp. SCN 64-44]
MTTQTVIRKKGWSRKQKRLALIAGLAAVLALATTLVLVALRDQIVFFYSPTELIAREIAPGHAVRIGGLVMNWEREGQLNRFAVTDGGEDIATEYTGILPDLFREGQGVVVEGSLSPEGVFKATNVLAKHDENYIPKEVVEALKAQGEWRPEGAQ